MTADVPPGFVALPLGKGTMLVIPAAVYLAGLRLGKQLRRRAARAKRIPETSQMGSDSASSRTLDGIPERKLTDPLP